MTRPHAARRRPDFEGGVRVTWAGRVLRLVVSDPFKLAGGFEVSVEDAHQAGSDVDALVVRTPDALEAGRAEHPYLVLRARYRQGLLAELKSGRRVVCSGTGTTAGAAMKGPPWGAEL